MVGLTVMVDTRLAGPLALREQAARLGSSRPVARWLM